MCVRVSVTDFVRQDRFEAAAEVAERVSVLVDLHALAVVFDLRVHPVGAFLHGIFDGLACLGLNIQYTGKKCICRLLLFKLILGGKKGRFNKIFSAFHFI